MFWQVLVPVIVKEEFKCYRDRALWIYN